MLGKISLTATITPELNTKSLPWFPGPCLSSLFYGGVLYQSLSKMSRALDRGLVFQFLNVISLLVLECP